MQKRVIILTGSAPPDACGVGDYSAALVSSLQEMGFPVELLCWKRWDVAGTAKIIRRLGLDKNALLHIQYPTFGYGYSLGPQVCALARRSVITLHEFSQAHPLRKASLFPFTLRPHRLVMTSAFEQRSLLKYMPWAAQKIKTIPIGSNIPSVRPLTIKQDRLRVIYHGLIMPRKGIEDFIALAQFARSRNADWDFIACGKVPEAHVEYGEVLMEASKDSAVQWILGRNENEVAAIFAEGGIAYLPFVDGASERRGSLKSVLASGLPTVTTVGAQTTENLKEAVLFADTPSAAYESIYRLAASPGARERLTQAAFRYSRSFNWQAIAEAHIRMYEELDH